MPATETQIETCPEKTEEGGGGLTSSAGFHFQSDHRQGWIRVLMGNANEVQTRALGGGKLLSRVAGGETQGRGG